MGSLGKGLECGSGIKTVIHPHPETKTLRQNLTIPIIAATAGAVDQSLGTVPLGAEKGGIRQGAITAHLAVKQEAFRRLFKAEQNSRPLLISIAEQAETGEQSPYNGFGKEERVAERI